MLKSNRLYFVNFLTGLLPPTRFYPLKRRLYKWTGVTIGSNVRLVSSVKIIGSGRLIIGDSTFIGHETLILIGGGCVEIGRDCDISSRVTIVTGTHKIAPYSKKIAGDGYSENIIVGKGCWIGVNSTILGGTNIPDLTLIAAHALARGELDQSGIYAGVPIKKIK